MKATFFVYVFMPAASKRKRKRCQAVTLGICPLPSMSFLLACLAMSLTLPARSTHTLDDRLENLSEKKKKVKQNSKAILCC